MNRFFLCLVMVAASAAPAAAGSLFSPWNTQDHAPANAHSLPANGQYGMYQAGMRHGSQPIMGGYRSDYYGGASCGCDPWTDRAPCCNNLWDSFCAKSKCWGHKKLFAGHGCCKAPAPSCCAPAPTCCKKPHFPLFKKHGGCSTCGTGCNSGCDTCGDVPCGCKKHHGLFAWLKSLHHRKCCNSCNVCGGAGCDSCGGGEIMSEAAGQYHETYLPADGEVIPHEAAPQAEDALPELELQKSAGWLMPPRMRLLPVSF